jgi:hypothetical protein
LDQLWGDIQKQIHISEVQTSGKSRETDFPRHWNVTGGNLHQLNSLCIEHDSKYLRIKL